jgi:hypothetical protein
MTRRVELRATEAGLLVERNTALRQPSAEQPTDFRLRAALTRPEREKGVSVKNMSGTFYYIRGWTRFSDKYLQQELGLHQLQRN